MAQELTMIALTKASLPTRRFKARSSRRRRRRRSRFRHHDEAAARDRASRIGRAAPATAISAMRSVARQADR
jgi:hypothetical protein